MGANQWQASVGFRWFESKRVFVYDQEVTQRYGQMVNVVYSFDLLASYGITPRWSVALDLPFIHATRSTLYEHDFVNQRRMSASGVGDLRLMTDFWLLDPHSHMDTAYRGSGPVTRPVDQSIQPGAGGWGVIFQLQAFQKIYGNLSGYLNGSYILTPEEQNGTEYPLADIPRTAAFFTTRQTHNSISDQYLGRGGLSYVIWPAQSLSVSFGARIEGIPAEDAIGGSLGFRRPGYTVSIEPGIAWSHKKNSLAVSVPIAMYRTRLQSIPEFELGRLPGDAAFADFSILASSSYRF